MKIVKDSKNRSDTRSSLSKIDSREVRSNWVTMQNYVRSNFTKWLVVSRD